MNLCFITPKKKALLLVGVLSLFLAAVSAAIFFHQNYKFNWPINRSLESLQAKELGGNTVAFVDRNGNSIAQFHEINGWLLLEAYLLQKKGAYLPNKLKDALSEWPSHQLSGWWPEKTRLAGKTYLLGLDPFFLPYDIDDTIWRFAIDGLQPSTLEVMQFLVSSPHTQKSQLCVKWGCNDSYMLRTWSNKDWMDDVDLVSISNAVSYIQSNDPVVQKALKESTQVINSMIRKGIDHNYYTYYEPKSAATALMLFYHLSRQRYLDPDTEKILRDRYARDRDSLNKSILISRWGGDRAPDEDWFMGLNFVYANEKIPPLLVLVLDSYLKNTN